MDLTRVSAIPEDKIKIIKGIEEAADKTKTYAMDIKYMVLHDMVNKFKGQLFVPIDVALRVKASERVQVYFDLELHPFFQKFKEFMSSKHDQQAVLRFRRMVGVGVDESIMLSDMYVLAKLFGELESIHIKRTKSHSTLRHIILTINFDGRTMAHLEYTFSEERESIYLEWSGVDCVVEYHSDDMNPISSNIDSIPPLLVDIESIVTQAHRFDHALLSQLEKFQTILNKGGRASE